MEAFDISGDLHLIAYIRARFYRRRQGFRLFFPEESFLEDEQGDHPDRNGRVRYIEDGSEEFKFLAPDPGHPFWKYAVEHGEIQHIHHAAMKERRITVS